MKLDKKIKDEIVSRITGNLKVKDIISFGSYAWGNPTEDSDIDLVVLLDENGFAKTFKERIDTIGRVSKLFYDLKAKIPMDILVYTKEEWKKADEVNSSIFKEIKNTGISLL